MTRFLLFFESGDSSSPCSETYAGPKAFSEVEMEIVNQQMLKYNSSIVVYLTFHSYGQYWIYPWGYDQSLPDDWKDLVRIYKGLILRTLKLLVTKN